MGVEHASLMVSCCRLQSSEAIRGRRPGTGCCSDIEWQETTQGMRGAAGKEGGGEEDHVGGQVPTDKVYGPIGRRGESGITLLFSARELLTSSIIVHFSAIES